MYGKLSFSCCLISQKARLTEGRICEVIKYNATAGITTEGSYCLSVEEPFKLSPFERAVLQLEQY